jgi:alpha-L-arabinofuranosidase
MIYEHSNKDGYDQFNVSLDDKQMVVGVTEEGIIMDVYNDDDLLGTVGMMFDEWAEWVVGKRRLIFDYGLGGSRSIENDNL